MNKNSALYVSRLAVKHNVSLETARAMYGQEVAEQCKGRYEQDNECPGHESTSGAAGISTYCDGTCLQRAASLRLQAIWATLPVKLA